MRMRCPRDKHHLTAEPIHGVNVQSCDHCFGIWLERAAALALTAYCGLEWPSAFAASSSSGAEEINLYCPSDNFRMVLIPWKGIEIAICRRCSGIWLDGGQYEQLIGHDFESPDTTVAVSSNDVDEVINAFTDMLSGFDFGF
jgi:Zn-finger nucleic acid-binding protein